MPDPEMEGIRKMLSRGQAQVIGAFWSNPVVTLKRHCCFCSKAAGGEQTAAQVFSEGRNSVWLWAEEDRWVRAG